MTTLASDRVSHEEQEEQEKWSLETTLVAKGLYFSDLTEDQLMAIFCKGPLLRFQICTVKVKCKRSGTQNKLYGFIRVVAEQTGDLASHFVFNRDYNDSIVIPYNDGALDGICCSIPAHNNVDIHAKLYVTTDKDFKKLPCVGDDDYLKIVEVKNFPKMDEVEKAPDYYDDAFYNGFLEMLNNPDEFPENEKEIDIKDDEPFEFCDDSRVINLSDGASFIGSNTLQGQGGSVRMYCLAFKYAVDATLEVEFVADNTETKVTGVVHAWYGNNFDYGSDCDNHLYTVNLLSTNYSESGHYLMPGKINLTTSALAVPAHCSLVIYARFMDITSWDEILNGSYEFHVPCDGSSSFGSITGIGCSLKLKVDWKLPPLNMRSL